ncbi:MAG: hypothetical protein E7629_05420 [Ruminococcaceae bacterium]|nr:hypothetical protein [Oscillospiraceae bacterium]
MNRIKTATKILTLLLSICMLLAVFASCATEAADTPEDSTDSASDSQPTVEATEEEIEFEVPVQNFDREMRCLGWSSSSTTQYCGEENSDDAVLRTIYERNKAVEEHLGFEYSWTYENGSYGQRENFCKTIEANSQGGTSFDAVVCYNLNPGLIASKGLAANLYEGDYLNLSAPWWPQTLISDAMVNNIIYSVVEANDYGLLKNIMAMFFNNSMLEASNIESPYDLVAKNEWTLEKFSMLVKDLYRDNGDNVLETAYDTFGYCGATAAKMDCWFFALGFRYTKVENDEVLHMIDVESFSTYVDTMVDFFESDSAVNYDTAQNKMFLEERAYFYSTGLFLTNEIAQHEANIDYGVVPLPKLNDQQDRYYTMVHNTHDAWIVPFDCKNLDESSAVLETSAYEAYKNIGPVYFDTYVKLRYAPDERLAEMYDLIRESVVFDFSYLYKSAYQTNPSDTVKNCINDPTKEWASVYATYKDQWQTSFESFVALYQKK